MSLNKKCNLEKLVIVGLSTNARHVFEFVTAYGLYEVIGFTVNKQYMISDSFKNLPIYPLEELEQHIDKNNVKLFVALLWNRLNADRKELFEKLSETGWRFANIISPYSQVRGNIEGTNVWIHDYVVIQNDTTIKNNVAIMGMSLVGANCEISSHCFLGARSTIGGGSRIGEQTFVGMNCTVFDQTTVGRKCILGACTAVKRDVPDFSLYKTSSDIVMMQYSENEIENKLLFKRNVR